MTLTLTLSLKGEGISLMAPRLSIKDGVMVR